MCYRTKISWYICPTCFYMWAYSSGNNEGLVMIPKIKKTGKSSWCHFHFQVPLRAPLSHTLERRTFSCCFWGGFFWFLFLFFFKAPTNAFKRFKTSYSWLQFYKKQTLKKKSLSFGTKFKTTKCSLHLTK